MNVNQIFRSMPEEIRLKISAEAKKLNMDPNAFLKKKTQIGITDREIRAVEGNKHVQTIQYS